MIGGYLYFGKRPYCLNHLWLPSAGEDMHPGVWWIDSLRIPHWVAPVPTHHIHWQAQCLLEIEGLAHWCCLRRLHDPSEWDGEGRARLPRICLGSQADARPGAQAGEMGPNIFLDIFSRIVLRKIGYHPSITEIYLGVLRCRYKILPLSCLRSFERSIRINIRYPNLSKLCTCNQFTIYLSKLECWKACMKHNPWQHLAGSSVVEKFVGSLTDPADNFNIIVDFMGFDGWPAAFSVNEVSRGNKWATGTICHHAHEASFVGEIINNKVFSLAREGKLKIPGFPNFMDVIEDLQRSGRANAPAKYDVCTALADGGLVIKSALIDLWTIKNEGYKDEAASWHILT